jgi:uncharacterized protein (TIGR02996 family)
VVVLIAFALGVTTAAAEPSFQNTLAQVQRLRDTGQFIEAVRVLRVLAVERPADAEIARVLAQTLYWAGDVDAARAAYELAVTRHPDDPTLRLEYARFLAETGDGARARTLLVPLQGRPGTQAEAAALLGTLAYWEGDVTGARRHFEAALQANPDHVEARRLLAEILAVTTPWVRVSSALAHDDQPLDRMGVSVEAGWFATPLTPVTVRVEPRRYDLGDGRTRPFTDAEVQLAHFAPRLRLDTEVAWGVLHRAGEGDGATNWKGRASLALRLPGHLRVGARGEWTPYLYTTASLDTPVVVQSGTALVRLDHPRGWLGEAAYQRQRFPDGNIVTSAYAWQLVPLVYRGGGELQVGYSVAAENAAESRFVLTAPGPPFPPGHPRVDAAGRYEPYYTPSDVLTHSVIAAAAARPSSRATIRVGGGYAFRATEQAPAFVVSAGALQRTMVPREFIAWNGRGSIEIAVSRNTTLVARGEAGRSAFYTSSAAAIEVAYRFGRGST